jgi:hypothetical protein
VRKLIKSLLGIDSISWKKWKYDHIFYGSNFILNHKFKYASVAISKNLTSSLKFKTLVDDYGFKPSDCDFHTIHKLFLEVSNETYDKSLRQPLSSLKKVRVKDCSLLQGYFKFSVFRDPVERVISFYNNKLTSIKCEREYWQLMDIFQNDTDRFINFLEFETKKRDPLNMDEHVRPQSKYYNLSDIDMVVSIKSFDKFISRFGGCPYLVNEGPSTKISFSDNQRNRIKQIYRDDYLLLENSKKYQKFFE